MSGEIKEKARPYFLRTAGDNLAILIHGFTGSPYELRGVGEFLASRGISAKAILLPGHGSHWSDLERITITDWQRAIDDELENAVREFNKIYLIGYSFGANLALDLAVRQPEKIKGVISLGISVYLRKDPLIRLLLPLANLFLKHYRKNYIRKRLIEEYEESGAYSVVPLRGLAEFYKFIDNFTKKKLAEVKIPTMIIHSIADRVIHPRSSEYLYQRIGSAQKELVILDDINHNPLNSKTRDEIFERIYQFIKRF